MDALRDEARKAAYQWRRPVVIVLDVLMGFRFFVGPHLEYLETEPARYLLAETVEPGV